MVYLTEQRIETVANYCRSNEYAKAAARIFNTSHSDHVTHQSVKQLMDKSRTSGFVPNRKHNSSVLSKMKHS